MDVSTDLTHEEKDVIPYPFSISTVRGLRSFPCFIFGAFLLCLFLHLISINFLGGYVWCMVCLGTIPPLFHYSFGTVTFGNYDVDEGYDYWNRVHESEHEVVSKEIEKQFPMQISMHGSSLQRLGVVFGFGILALVSYSIFVFSQSPTAPPPFIIQAFYAISLFAFSCVMCLKTFVSNVAIPPTGTSVRGLMGFVWKDEHHLHHINLNTKTASFFALWNRNLLIHNDIYMVSAFLFAGLMPMMASGFVVVSL